MSDTNETSKVPNNLINYMVCGVDDALIFDATGKTQPANVDNIPGMPMGIHVDTNEFEILPNGEILRKRKDGSDLSKVKDPNTIKKLKEKAKTKTTLEGQSR